MTLDEIYLKSQAEMGLWCGILPILQWAAIKNRMRYYTDGRPPEPDLLEEK